MVVAGVYTNHWVKPQTKGESAVNKDVGPLDSVDDFNYFPQDSLSGLWSDFLVHILRYFLERQLQVALLFHQVAWGARIKALEENIDEFQQNISVLPPFHLVVDHTSRELVWVSGAQYSVGKVTKSCELRVYKPKTSCNYIQPREEPHLCMSKQTVASTKVCLKWHSANIPVQRFW